MTRENAQTTTMSLVHFPSTSRILVDLAHQPMPSRAHPEPCTVYIPCKVSPHHLHREMYIGLRQSCQCWISVNDKNRNYFFVSVAYILIITGYLHFLAIYLCSFLLLDSFPSLYEVGTTMQVTSI